MTTSSPRTAGATYRVEPKPPIDRNDQVTFGGRTGRVTGLTVDTMGNVLVAVAEVFPNGEMLTEEADGVEAIVVPISQVTPTGLRYEIEGWDDSGSRSDVVVAGATSAACSCNERRAAIDKGAAPADVTVADPTNDILLERLDAAERTIAALNERIDTMEAAVAMSHEAAQVAASLGITS